MAQQPDLFEQLQRLRGGAVVELALDEPELSPRELAVRFTDTKRYFISEASCPPSALLGHLS